MDFFLWGISQYNFQAETYPKFFKDKSGYPGISQGPGMSRDISTYPDLHHQYSLSDGARPFIDSAWELPTNFFAQKQLHFLLLVGLKAINTSEFNQSFWWMKFWPQCPNLCSFHLAFLAREQMLAQLCYVVRAYCQNLGRVQALSVQCTKAASIK